MAANANIAVARAAYFPTIDLTASGGYASTALDTLLLPESRVFALTAALSQTIFDGGVLRGQSNTPGPAMPELLSDYHKTVLTALGNVEDALVAVQQTSEQELRQQVAVDKARRAFEFAQLQFQAGTINVLTVLNTETALFTAQDTLVQVKFQHLQALVDLYQALGGGWQHPGGANEPLIWKLPPGQRHRRVVLGAGVTLLVLVGWAWLSRNPATAALPSGGPAAVPVDTALATRRDVPVYLEGLGNVQAFYTAKITARVDGQLQRVGSSRANWSRKAICWRRSIRGRCRPRSTRPRVQAKDAAQLDSAKRDLERYTTLAPQYLISRQVLDTQRALVAQLQAQLQVDRGLIENARTQLSTPASRRHFPGAPASAWWTRAISSTPADTTGIVVVTQIQPISVMFTLPEDVAAAGQSGAGRRSVAVTALSRDDRTQLDNGTLRWSTTRSIKPPARYA